MAPPVKRGALLAVILVVFGVSWFKLRQVPLLVIGQPTTTGALQQDREAPFFAELARATDLPLKVTYEPLNKVGLKDTYQLQMLKNHEFDLVSLRFIQNSDQEPSLEGVDMVGLSPDLDTAHRVARRYAGTLDHYLQQNYDAKLLGIWAFGPQVFFCRVPVHGITDIAGLKVRVASQSSATLISDLGGIPAVIPFDDTNNALAVGLIDCAVTSAASAVSAGWVQHTGYYFPLPTNFGLNGYAISRKTWNRFSPAEQAGIQRAFDTYVDALWGFAATLHRDASNCIVGRSCPTGTPYRLTLAEPSPQDFARLSQVARTHVLPHWATRCEQVHPGCSNEWREEVLPVVG